MLIEFRVISDGCVYACKNLSKKNDIETEFLSFCLFLFN